DADTKGDASVGRQRGIVLGQDHLDFGPTSESVDDARELDEQSVAGRLHKTALILRDFWIDCFGAKRPEPADRAFLVPFHQPGVSRDIGGEDCRQPTFNARWPYRLHNRYLTPT